jgi:ABC-type uncharacterized transport system involved in gliding motility auxiliary subunit
MKYLISMGVVLAACGALTSYSLTDTPAKHPTELSAGREARSVTVSATATPVPATTTTTAATTPTTQPSPQASTTQGQSAVNPTQAAVNNDRSAVQEDASSIQTYTADQQGLQSKINQLQAEGNQTAAGNDAFQLNIIESLLTSEQTQYQQDEANLANAEKGAAGS